MVFDDRFYAGARITSGGADPTHHIKVGDGDRSVGFVITDQSGDRSERTFRRFPHSDPAQPYITEKQTAFGGGFGQSIFEENRSKYWRGLGVDTVKDVLVLGPAAHHAKGTFVKAQDNLQYDTFAWANVGSGGRKWVAIPFTPAQEWTGTTYLKLYMRRVGNPADLRVRTYTNVGDEPSVQIHTQDFAADDVITDLDGQWIRLDITDTYTYAASTKFWIVLTVAAGGAGEWWVGVRRGGGNGLKSSDGAAWATASWDVYYRIYGENDGMVARWIDYKQQTYALLDYDSTDECELWMNGWRGACDDNTGNLNSLLDATSQGNEWATKMTGDEVVKIVAGPASGEYDDFRLVSSAANNDITVTPNWIIDQDIHDDYVVQNSDWFQQISAPVGYLSGKVTEVAVANGQMFMARAGKRGMVYHNEINLGGSYDQSSYWYVNPNVHGEFVRAMRDPIQGEVLWIGNNAKEAGAWKPYVYMTPPNIELTTAGILNSQILCNNWGSSGITGVFEYWEADVATHVSITGGAQQAQIQVLTARVDTVATTATGANYQVNDILTLTEIGSSGTATVKVLTIDGSGQPTSLEVATVGYDYTTGIKGTTGGSGDGNCTVNITALVTVQGLIAHINFKDRDGTARTVDLRHMTDMKMVIKFEILVKNNFLTLSSTDIKLNLSSVAGGTSAFVDLNVPDMVSNTQSDKPKYFSLDLQDTAGAEKCTSMGLTVTEQVRSYRITFVGPAHCWRDVEPVNVGQVDGDNITGLENFGDPEQMWVFTEAGYGPINNNRFMPVPMREIKVARHANNGRGHEVHDVYLLFTWKGRLQRYYRQNLEDLGPDFPEGMGDIAGEVVDVKTYPGRFYVAIDGGESGKSMILCHKGGGWHEVYTSFTGERIRSLFVQAIEAKSDKLWAAVGSDLMWFPIELSSAELPANTDYRYRPTGYLDTSWIYTASRELDKAFRSILVTLERAKDSNLDLRVLYQIDDPDATWILLDRKDEFSSSTLRYKMETFGQNAKGNRIRFRFELTTRDMTKSPVLRSYQARMYRMSEVKFSYTWLSKLSTISVNLRGDEEKVVGQFKTCQQAFDLIDAWAANATPLKITSSIASIHDKEVVIEPVPAQLLMIVHDEQIQEQSIQMQANDA
jgi:hypothetical protein